MKFCRLAITTALVLVFAGASAQTVHYLGDLDTEITSLPVEPTGPCYFGNLRVPGALEPFCPDIFSMHAELDSVACGCEGGWMVSEVHMLLVNLAAGPTMLYIAIYVDEQGWCTYPSGCLEPHPGYWGDLLEVYTEILLPESGYYELVVTGNSPCAYFGYEYFFEIWSYEPDVQLVVDADGARECEVLMGNHIHEIWWWTDPHGEFWQMTSGAPIWWVEAECCEDPVPTEARSWGGVKSLYR